MFVKPAEGRLVRDPFTRLPVSAAGQDWPDNDPTLAVLLLHGDLESATQDAVQDPAPDAEAAAEAAPAEAHGGEG